MAENPTLNTLASLQNEPTAINVINDNFSAVASSFEDTLSLSGILPNAMQSPLDMNSYQIINLSAPISGDSPLRLQDASTLNGGGTIFVSNVIGVEYVIDGGGIQLIPGIHGSIMVPFPATITQVNLLADQMGSAVVDVWKCPYTSYSPPTHPVVGDSITASDLPTITSATKYQDTTLTGWTTNINANDILTFNVNSCTTITRLTICLTVNKT